MTRIDIQTSEIALTKSELEFISDVFHDYKDYHRNDRKNIKKAMRIEKKLSRAFNYSADTTYDWK